MVGTNWGAQQYRRAREIAWTGATTVAALCGTIGFIVAFRPSLWIGLFSDDAEVARLGTLYLRIVGPAYLLFGLGLGLFYVTLGFGRAVAAMNANAVRVVASAAGGLIAIYGFDLGITGFFCRGRRRILPLRGNACPRGVQREGALLRTADGFVSR
jgi:Na+-driven multidrug efflux pump